MSAPARRSRRRAAQTVADDPSKPLLVLDIIVLSLSLSRHHRSMLLARSPHDSGLTTSSVRRLVAFRHAQSSDPPACGQAAQLRPTVAASPDTLRRLLERHADRKGPPPISAVVVIDTAEGAGIGSTTRETTGTC